MPHEIEDCETRMGLAVNLMSIDSASALSVANGIAIAMGSEDAIEHSLRGIGLPEKSVKEAVMEVWSARQASKHGN